MNGQTEKKEPSNEFRDELEAKAEAERDPVEVETEKVGEQEMMRRDTFATMRSLQVQRDVLAMDQAHATTAGMYYNKFVSELRELPISEATVSIIEGLEEQAKALLTVGEKSVLTRASKVMLEALEANVVGEVNAVDQESLNQASASEIVDDDDESLDDEPTGPETI